MQKSSWLRPGRHTVVYVLALFLAGNLSSCAPAVTPAAVPSVVLGPMTAQTTDVITEFVDQNNCGGTIAVTNGVTRSRAIRQEIVTEGEFSVNASGEIGILGTGVELGAQVAARLGYTYGNEETIERTISVGAAPGTHMQHQIVQQEIWQAGSAIITIGQISQTVIFRFRSDFGVTLLESEQAPCPTATPSPLEKHTSQRDTTSPTAPHTFTPTPTITDTPLPTGTNTPTQTSTRTPIPTDTRTATPPATSTPSREASPQWLRISIVNIATDSSQSGYTAPPLGEVTLGGVPFELPPGPNSVTTQAESLPNNPLSIRLTGLNISSATRVHLLITGGHVRREFEGRKIGSVELHFADGGSHRIDLIPGRTIREWKTYGEHNVTWLGEPAMQEVWSTYNHFDSSDAVIDMLTIFVPENLQESTLDQIVVTDTSNESVGSMNPAINLLGVTVRLN